METKTENFHINIENFLKNYTSNHIAMINSFENYRHVFNVKASDININNSFNFNYLLSYDLNKYPLLKYSMKTFLMLSELLSRSHQNYNIFIKPYNKSRDHWSSSYQLDSFVILTNIIKIDVAGVEEQSLPVSLKDFKKLMKIQYFKSDDVVNSGMTEDKKEYILNDLIDDYSNTNLASFLEHIYEFKDELKTPISKYWVSDKPEGIIYRIEIEPETIEILENFVDMEIMLENIVEI